MFIESAANDRVKAWAKLKTRKGRQQQGAFLVEGLRLVEELLASNRAVENILWDVGTDELPDTLLETVHARRIPLIEMSPEAFSTVTDTVSSQGLIAVAKLQHQAEPDYPSTVVLFDGLQDPGNLGTLIRSAFAFGCGEVVAATGSVDPYSPKVVRATMGSLFRISTVVQGASEYIAAWKERHPQGQVVTTDVNAQALVHEQTFHGPCLVVIGNESNGVTAETAALATASVRIAMEPGAESLNAAMAGTIVLYEVYRQR